MERVITGSVSPLELRSGGERSDRPLHNERACGSRDLREVSPGEENPPDSDG